MYKIEENNSLGNTSASDSPNENGKREKRRNRSTKDKIYAEEREELVNELEKKMGLDEEIRGIILYDLENNKELKEYLRDKIPEIRKLYKTGNWNYFVKQHTKEGEELSEISLLKSIYKEEKYKLISKRKMLEKEGKKKQYSCIFFYKEYKLEEKIKY
jgi:hypothetical protein